MKKKLLWLCLTFFIGSTTAAADVLQQAKNWSGIDFTGSLFGSNFVYDFFPQARTNLSDEEYDETHTEAGIGYKLTPNFSVWQGYTLALPGVVDEEHDVWQQIMWNIVNTDKVVFLSRTRLEERRDVNFSQWADTFRQRVGINFPNLIMHEYTPIIYDEVFFNLNHPVWVNDQTLNQNRAFVGIRFPVAKWATIDLGYLNQYVFKNTINQMNHIIYLNLNITT